ncbi:MAG: sodium-translocating pyrophosphatase [Microgenomates group bacterium]
MDLVLCCVMGTAALGFGIRNFVWTLAQPSGSARAKEYARHIQVGSNAYLVRLYGILLAVAIVFAILIGLLYGNVGMGVSYIAGAGASALAGYLGMSVAVRANVRTAVACQKSLGTAFNVAFKGGSVLGLAMTGLGLIGMALIYMLTKDVQFILAFSFGASTLALLAKAGGGIYTKTADIAADLVGKVEKGLPEDDPRNAAVMADNVGDNVGDVAGMGADIFDSYVAAALGAMALAALSNISGSLTVFPLVIYAVGILASIIGTMIIKVKDDGDPGRALNNGTIVTCIIFAVLVFVAMLIGGYPIGLMLPIASGILVGVVIGIVSDYFTNDIHAPVKNTANESKGGPALTILSGFSYGLISTVPVVIGVVVAMLVAYYSAQAVGFDGMIGIGLSAAGMLATVGLVASSDAYGPIVDNAKGIAEMAGLGEEVIKHADVLDSAGNTAKAVTKGYAIAAAAMTVLALFVSYGLETQSLGHVLDLNLMHPIVIAGVFIGGITPVLFSALLILAVVKNAKLMVEEVRRQFDEHPGIMEGKELPDYSRCVGMASNGAFKALGIPAFLAIVLPVLVGLILGPDAVGAFLAGSIIVGVILALLMANSGGLWDNAKKLIEAGFGAGKNSEQHKAAVIGDTVGDPFKDTAGPSINTLITVMILAATLFAPLYIW